MYHKDMNDDELSDYFDAQVERLERLESPTLEDADPESRGRVSALVQSLEAEILRRREAKK
jgi:hypothetical protein